MPTTADKKEGGVLYFAYGSNLNIEQMKSRCPAAQPLRRFKVTDARLVFRGFADCAYEPGAVCHGGVWRITPQCEAALDIYEEVTSGMYRKELVELPAPIEGEAQLMLYIMNSTGIMPPSLSYLEVIRQGYRDFKLPVAALDHAVRTSRNASSPAASGSL
jgi:gamma-glutamylcyclotransferase (GGCT)/AIG2-like uncharacterized protein YtfP